MKPDKEMNNLNVMLPDGSERIIQVTDSVLDLVQEWINVDPRFHDEFRSAEQQVIPHRHLYEFFDRQKIVVYYAPVAPDWTPIDVFSFYVAANKFGGAKSECIMQYDWHDPESEFPSRAECEVKAFEYSFVILERRIRKLAMLALQQRLIDSGIAFSVLPDFLEIKENTTVTVKVSEFERRETILVYYHNGLQNLQAGFFYDDTDFTRIAEFIQDLVSRKLFGRHDFTIYNKATYTDRKGMCLVYEISGKEYQEGRVGHHDPYITAAVQKLEKIATKYPDCIPEITYGLAVKFRWAIRENQLRGWQGIRSIEGVRNFIKTVKSNQEKALENL